MLDSLLPQPKFELPMQGNVMKSTSGGNAPRFNHLVALAVTGWSTKLQGQSGMGGGGPPLRVVTWYLYE